MSKIPVHMFVSVSYMKQGGFKEVKNGKFEELK